MTNTHSMDHFWIIVDNVSGYELDRILRFMSILSRLRLQKWDLLLKVFNDRWSESYLEVFLNIRILHFQLRKTLNPFFCWSNLLLHWLLVQLLHVCIQQPWVIFLSLVQMFFQSVLNVYFIDPFWTSLLLVWVVLVSTRLRLEKRTLLIGGLRRLHGLSSSWLGNRICIILSLIKPRNSLTSLFFQDTFLLCQFLSWSQIDLEYIGSWMLRLDVSFLRLV